MIAVSQASPPDRRMCALITPISKSHVVFPKQVAGALTVPTRHGVQSTPGALPRADMPDLDSQEENGPTCQDMRTSRNPLAGL